MDFTSFFLKRAVAWLILGLIVGGGPISLALIPACAAKLPGLPYCPGGEPCRFQ
jgi:hypothetical protein